MGRVGALVREEVLRVLPALIKAAGAQQADVRGPPSPHTPPQEARSRGEAPGLLRPEPAQAVHESQINVEEVGAPAFPGLIGAPGGEAQGSSVQGSWPASVCRAPPAGGAAPGDVATGGGFFGKAEVNNAFLEFRGAGELQAPPRCASAPPALGCKAALPGQRASEHAVSEDADEDVTEDARDGSGGGAAAVTGIAGDVWCKPAAGAPREAEDDQPEPEKEVADVKPAEGGMEVPLVQSGPAADEGAELPGKRHKKTRGEQRRASLAARAAAVAPPGPAERPGGSKLIHNDIGQESPEVPKDGMDKLMEPPVTTGMADKAMMTRRAAAAVKAAAGAPPRPVEQPGGPKLIHDDVGHADPDVPKDVMCTLMGPPVTTPPGNHRTGASVFLSPPTTPDPNPREEPRSAQGSACGGSPAVHPRPRPAADGCPLLGEELRKRKAALEALQRAGRLLFASAGRPSH